MKNGDIYYVCGLDCQMELNLLENVQPTPFVKCHLSFVTCHMSHVTCNLTCVTCHVSPVIHHLSPVTCHLFKYINKVEAFTGSVLGAIS